MNSTQPRFFPASYVVGVEAKRISLVEVSVGKLCGEAPEWSPSAESWERPPLGDTSAGRSWQGWVGSMG